ncbi:hypothetical protein EDC96DRAFT_545225 [Choanephora cucurbitarum]|nr:hypothetical protein EDC96DRAFT_545225 [Choanephora cucurbitarum]
MTKYIGSRRQYYFVMIDYDLGLQVLSDRGTVDLRKRSFVEKTNLDDLEPDAHDILLHLASSTNSGSLSNQTIIDFANTEEIPAFLRNWNVNKKRKFKPKASSSSPAKRQRRSGPDHL